MPKSDRCRSRQRHGAITFQINIDIACFVDHLRQSLARGFLPA
jgi:hypothetical protein